MKSKSVITALLAVALVFVVAAAAVGFETVTPKAFADGNGPPYGCDANSQGFKSSHECKHPPG